MELTGVGYRGHQPPYDAFWGSRYAIVEDRDSTLWSGLRPALTLLNVGAEANDSDATVAGGSLGAKGTRFLQR